MTLKLEIPQELERELATEAARLGLPLPEYALRLLYSRQAMEKTPQTGAELVAYWQNAGLVGTREDITDETGAKVSSSATNRLALGSRLQPGFV